MLLLIRPENKQSFIFNHLKPQVKLKKQKTQERLIILIIFSK